mmetsp:Transcript_18386/g.27527  ORF Transcript_18386/g.27527 Transcript_18386/m.27527 type:complete len:500 (+) Transcript_18386:134-1633(+)|eukprot:CAMPEP_0167749188 /NCGR_PEP_ID=MMETSP0110_2-20121227/5260_1 /TAXON_ID=629695 /ORGANISM="Gymnochlora sp., Strain CCMP2014" /LENGTH=499 /DNA_ID=CAMNT_0007634297 /DNA_START=72 /DNA_END=1571 /DNA_ORIENTATION=+
MRRFQRRPLNIGVLLGGLALVSLWCNAAIQKTNGEGNLRSALSQISKSRAPLGGMHRNKVLSRPSLDTISRDVSRKAFVMNNEALRGRFGGIPELSRPKSRVPVWVVRGRDFYKILGVSRGADVRAIKKAYRQLSKKYHPDVNQSPEAEKVFSEINAAYDCLRDSEKREVYDKFGEEGLSASAQGMDGDPFGGFGGGQNPFDIFESFFGGGGGGGFGTGGSSVNLEDLFGNGGMGGMGGGGTSTERQTMRGDNKVVTLNVDFMDAVFGANKEFEVSRFETCGTCGGSGAKPGTMPKVCTTCGGRGQVMSVMRTPLGQLQQIQTCPDCEGTGTILEKCGSCYGEGRISGTRKISLRVPPGIDSGQRLRVRGEGDAGLRGGGRGDLFVQINVKQHPEFRRDGSTIHSDVKISYVDAILGAQIKVKTVDGLVDMKVPKGTQPETTLVMRSRGIPELGGSDKRGDHHVHVKVVIPKEPDDKEMKMVEKIRASLKEEKKRKKDA